MKAPDGAWFELEECGSTQDVAAALLDSPDCPAVVFTHHQVEGRGRFRRSWHSRRGDSLTFSLLFHQYKGHQKPWLIGMAVAVAVARAVGGRVQWPNDVVMGGKKVAGILIELLPVDAAEKTPVVGVGVNLNQTAFPLELDHRATSLRLQTGEVYDAKRVAEAIVAAVSGLPEPNAWSDLAPAWAALDETPGKRFVLASDETAVAVRVGESGELVCTVDGVERSVLAADAVFTP